MAISKNIEFYLTEHWILDISCFDANNKPLKLSGVRPSTFKYRIIAEIDVYPK